MQIYTPTYMLKKKSGILTTSLHTHTYINLTELYKYTHSHTQTHVKMRIYTHKYTLTYVLKKKHRKNTPTNIHTGTYRNWCKCTCIQKTVKSIYSHSYLYTYAGAHTYTCTEMLNTTDTQA